MILSQDVGPMCMPGGAGGRLGDGYVRNAGSNSNAGCKWLGLHMKEKLS